MSMAFEDSSSFWLGLPAMSISDSTRASFDAAARDCGEGVVVSVETPILLVKSI